MPKTSSGIPNGMLLLVAEMVDRQLVYLSVGLSGERRSVGQFVSLVDGKRVDAKRLDFAVKTTDFTGLWSRALLSRLDREKLEARICKLDPRERDKSEKPEDRRRLAWYEHPNAPNKAAVELVQAERDRIETLRAEIRERLDNPRLVVSKASAPYTGKQQPGVGHLYIITGETAQRWNVTPWEKSRNFEHDWLVQGHGNTMTLDKDKVAAIDVTPAQFAAMKQATQYWNERVADARGTAASEEAAVLAPIRRRLAEREEQLTAMLADEMREAIQGPDTGGPKP